MRGAYRPYRRSRHAAENAKTARFPKVRAQSVPSCIVRDRCGVRQGNVARARSVSVHLLLELAALLSLERKRGRRTRHQTGYADRITRFLAVAVITVINSLDGSLHLLEQLAFAVAGAQLKRVLFLNRRTVRRIRNNSRLAQIDRRLGQP